MRKIINIFLFVVLFFSANCADARIFQSPVDFAKEKAGIKNSAMIAVSFIDVNTGKVKFAQNEKIPVPVASVQKIVTLAPSINTLGTNYNFSTKLYKSNDKSVYLKLGANPYLTTKDLRNLFSTLPKYKITTINKFGIDDSILDAEIWGEGWQWDNELNPLMPKFSPYNLNSNVLTLTFSPTTKGNVSEINQSSFYPLCIQNEVMTGAGNSISLRESQIYSADVIIANGEVSKDVAVVVPVKYPRRYFVLQTQEALDKAKVKYYGEFDRVKIPNKTYLIAEHKSSISLAIPDILKRSNNMVAETVFKLAGGKYAKTAGNVEDAVSMLKDYYNAQGIDTEGIGVFDGSGVSKNNLLNAYFVSNVLYKDLSTNSKFHLEENLATPGEGTLSNRMLYFSKNLRAKTGTLTNVSSIAGYLTTKSGKKYAFCIVINDANSKSFDKKSFEEYLLRRVYEIW
ncbi:MAG: D-alanyl-D-alanine carboxypeptidase/D-alanyl-D-alanine-endopeptidase [bacterium]|nr:D-alanyl-D-alanine carboxypeptidase/D-alanyl-D-alanine-endopeptidase [bacterium]